MNKLIIIILSFFFVGCGMAENIGGKCGGDHKELCHFIFGGKEDKDQNNRIDELEKEYIALQEANVSIKNDINVLDSLLDLIEIQLNTTTTIQNNLTTQLSLVETNINSLQTTLTSNNLRLIELEGNHNITRIVDPCGNQPGFDEVFFKTSTGLIVASFSQNPSGLNTRFVILEPGIYTTTDGTSCTFTVSSLGTVTPSVEY